MKTVFRKKRAKSLGFEEATEFNHLLDTNQTLQRGMEQRLRGEPPRTGTSDPGAAFLARVRAAAGLEK